MIISNFPEFHLLLPSVNFTFHKLVSHYLSPQLLLAQANYFRIFIFLCIMGAAIVTAHIFFRLITLQ